MAPSRRQGGSLSEQGTGSGACRQHARPSVVRPRPSAYSEGNSEARDGRTRFLFGAGSFLLAVLAVLPAWRRGLLDDPALGRHLRGPDAIRAGGWPKTDPFLADGATEPWLDAEWLGEWGLWLGERWAGLEGIAAVAKLAIAGTLAGVYLALRRDGRSWPAALGWTGLAALGTSGQWVAGPALFAWPLTLVTVRLCERFHAGACSRRTTWLLWPLFVVWANAGPTFVPGLVLLAATALMECAVGVAGLTFEERDRARDRAAHWIVLLGGALLCTAVNPYGVRLHFWLFRLWTDPVLSSAREAPSFLEAGLWRTGLFVLLFPVLAGATARRPGAVELVLCVALLAAVLAAATVAPLFVVSVTPLLARSAAGLPWLERFRPQPLREGSGPDRSLAALRPCLRTGLLGLVLVAACRGVEGRLAALDRQRTPTATLHRLLEWQRHHPDGEVFHEPEWGGYLIWKGWPDCRPRCDDRQEIRSPGRRANDRLVLRMEWKQLRRMEDEDEILVGVRTDRPVAGYLGSSQKWGPLRVKGGGEADAGAVLFVREQTQDIAKAPTGRDK